MAAEMLVAAVLALVGVLALLGSWMVHWVLRLVGVGLLASAAYVAFGGPLPGV
jgi:hypothetical protein